MDPPARRSRFEFIGYRELREHLEGRTTLEQAAQAITVATRQYAKRQMTWFRKEPDVRWIEGFGDDPAIAREAISHIEKELGIASLELPAAPPDLFRKRVVWKFDENLPYN